MRLLLASVLATVVWGTAQARITRIWDENRAIDGSCAIWPLPHDCSSISLEACVAMEGPSDCLGADRHSWNLTLLLADGTSRVVTIGWGNTCLGDFSDRRYLSVDGVDDPSGQVRLTSDVNLYSGDNSIVVEIDPPGSKARIYVGDDVMNYAGSVTLSSPVDSVSVGTHGKIELAFMAIECEHESRLDSGLDDRELQQACAPGQEAPLGMWRYLDRDNDATFARPGGFYTLAAVADPSEHGAYLLLYIDGARVNATGWQAGMIKGRLTPTRFIGRYRLEWRNADKTILQDESVAVLEGDILTLSFPLHQSHLRFTR